MDVKYIFICACLVLVVCLSAEAKPEPARAAVGLMKGMMKQLKESPDLVIDMGKKVLDNVKQGKREREKPSAHLKYNFRPLPGAVAASGSGAPAAVPPPQSS